MAVINEGEILARMHKFKLFRKEGNLFIDLYEALLGEPAHKFVAVPNLWFQEAEKEFFGVGDTKGAALKDCLGKIKDLPIDVIVSPMGPEEPLEDNQFAHEPEEEPKLRQSFWRLPQIFSRGKKK